MKRVSIAGVLALLATPAFAQQGAPGLQDNLWVVDKASMSVMKFNPEGMVLMNLGR